VYYQVVNKQKACSDVIERACKITWCKHKRRGNRWASNSHIQHTTTPEIRQWPKCSFI